jgi:hypothetical protein
MSAASSGTRIIQCVVGCWEGQKHGQARQRSAGGLAKMAMTERDFAEGDFATTSRCHVWAAFLIAMF